MSYTEEDFERFQRNELKKSDTFQFGCQMCGSCCRNRKEPVLITGYDLFRIAKELDVPVPEAMFKNTRGYLGDSSHCPVIVLDERLDGSCRLLRKGRCIVHSNKPSACALFPLGRYLDMRDGQYHYFFNGGCSKGNDDETTWTVQEWLENFKIEENERYVREWHKLFSGIACVTAQIDKSEISKRIVDAMVFVLYLDYDTSLPYQEQVEKNKMIAQAVFKKELDKTISFQ